MAWYSKVQKTASGGVVSFDFDDTLASPEWDDENWIFSSDNMSPNKQIISKLKEEHENGNEIVIVTSRNSASEPEVREFIEENNLPIERVYFTNGEPKGPVLRTIGAIRHYDDSEAELDSAKEFGVNTYQVGHPQDKLISEALIRYLAIESRGESFKTEEDARQWVLKELESSDLSEEEKDIQSKLIPYHKTKDGYAIGIKEISDLTEEDKWATTRIDSVDDPSLSGAILAKIDDIFPSKKANDSEVNVIIDRLKQRPSFFQAIIVDKQNRIIDGNARYYAASDLGLTKIPTQWKIESETENEQPE